MTVIITAFAQSPDHGQGQARDMRIRWALEEVEQPYNVRLVSFREMKEPAHLAIQPFGQIPTYEEDGLRLFESGSIVLHIVQGDTGLLPDDPHPRARAITWMFAALNTVEPPLVEIEAAKLLEGDKSWHAQRLPLLEERARTRLDSLSRRLGDAQWLDGSFTAGDLMMIGVLFRTKDLGLLAHYPNLREYVSRGEDRPAFRRAFAAQRAVFLESQKV